MVFSSALFLFLFLPVFLTVYFLLPYRFKNFWTLLASLAFYAWGAPVFVFVLVFSVLIDFLLVNAWLKWPGKRRLLLWIGVAGNVTLLGYFKYANFFVHNLNSALYKVGFDEVSWTAVVLPIGISFFTFQKISYLIDVYREIREPLKKYSDHLLYVALFPQLIAGPIVRYNEIADDMLKRESKITADNRLLGFFRFSIGLGKKVLIANVLGEQADLMFNAELHTLSSAQVWLGVVCYTFQIYFDFSGYSDMAIGLGRMLGFTFPENFNYPYISKSITEFWRRWHITLSNWMRDYLYLPLGGNRVSKGRLYLNLWLVFLLSGLWHGAAWTFVIWGIYHGFWLVLERLVLLRLFQKIPGFVRILFTFLIVLFGWIFFRVDYVSHAIELIKIMLTFIPENSPSPIDTQVLVTLIIAIGFSVMALFEPVRRWQYTVLNSTLTNGSAILITLVSLILLVVSTSFILSMEFNPFIYFQF